MSEYFKNIPEIIESETGAALATRTESMGEL